MIRLGSLSRYALCGGASVAAYDCSVNEGSAVAEIIKLVTSASSPLDKLLPALPSLEAASAPAVAAADMSAISAKLDHLTQLSLTRPVVLTAGGRLSLFGLASGAIMGGLLVWAVSSGRLWPSVLRQLEQMMESISAVDVKIDARAEELLERVDERIAEVKAEVQMVGEKVERLDAKTDEIAARVTEIADVARENNQGASRLESTLHALQAHVHPINTHPRRHPHPLRGGGLQL